MSFCLQFTWKLNFLQSLELIYVASLQTYEYSAVSFGLQLTWKLNLLQSLELINEALLHF